MNEPDRRGRGRSTQADRSARTRSALLESARGLSRYGYGNLVLEQVASLVQCLRRR